MKGFHFFALLSRMKYIFRWGLMRNARQENLSEHTLEVAYIAHALALMSHLDPSRAVMCALYHDCGEIITGDLPTPVKYRDPLLRESYRRLENQANHRLLACLPEDLTAGYRACLLETDPETLRIVKAADKLSALIKCIEEIRMGNDDFKSARAAQLSALGAMELPAAERFLKEFMPSFERTLDELQTD